MSVRPFSQHYIKIVIIYLLGFQNYVRSILTCVFVCVGLYCSTLSCALFIIHVVDFRVLMLSHFDFDGFFMYVVIYVNCVWICCCFVRLVCDYIWI